MSLRVEDVSRSLAFYGALGYEVVGEVPGTPIGDLTMLKLPDDPFVALELVHDPAGEPVDVGTGISHLVVQVDSLEDALARLWDWGLDGAQAPTDAEEIRTSMIADPDGYPIELVQWPPGHGVRMTAADFG